MDVSRDLAVLGILKYGWQECEYWRQRYRSSFVDVSGGVVCDGRESVLWQVYVSEVSAFGGTVVIETVC
jgi:hypothetical protein